MTLLSPRSSYLASSIALLAAALAPACSSGDAPHGADEHASDTQELRGGWQQVGLTPAYASGAAALSSWAANRLDVWVTGADGRLYHTVRNETSPPSWQGWDSLAPPPGTTIVGEPAAISRALNQIDLVVSGADGNLYYINYNASVGWSTWQNLGNGGCPSGNATNPALNSWSSGRLDLWARCSNGTIVHDVKTTAWSGWAGGGTLASPGGAVVAGPTAVSRGLNLIDVAVQTSDGRVWVDTFNGSGWTGWTSWGVFYQARSLSIAVNPTSTTTPTLFVTPSPSYTSLYVLNGPNTATFVDKEPGSVPVTALRRQGATTIDLVDSVGYYQYTKWTPPPGDKTNVVLDAQGVAEPSTIAMPGGIAGCPAGGRVISTYTNAVGSGRAVVTRDVATGTTTVTDYSSLPGYLPGDIVEEDNQLIRSPAGNAILVRGVLRPTPGNGAGTYESGTMLWRSSTCGTSWTNIGYISPSAYNPQYGKPQCDFNPPAPPVCAKPIYCGNCGGWDYEQVAVDAAGKLSITVSAHGGTPSTGGMAVDGVVLTSDQSIDSTTLPITFSLIKVEPNAKLASADVTSVNGTTYLLDCAPGTASNLAIPRLRWLRANGALGPSTPIGVPTTDANNATYQYQGLGVAWDGGQGHATAMVDTACQSPTWGNEGSTRVTPWTSYVKNGVTYDALRVAYPTVSQYGYQAVRVLKVIVPSDGSTPTVTNVLSIGAGFSGVSGSVTQATWIGADLTQSGADPTAALVYWQENDKGPSCGLPGGSTCTWTAKSAVMSDTDLSPAALLGTSATTACPAGSGGCAPGDYTKGGFFVSGTTQSFVPSWIQAGTTGLNAAVISVPKLN